MKEFNQETIETVIDYLLTDYSLALEQDKDFLFYYIDVFNIEEPESNKYFQFVISADGLRFEGSECADMEAQYTPDEFESTGDVLKCIKNELHYYLPISILREYKIKKILEG